MNATDSLLNNLKRQRPEWEPWLGVVEVALRESEQPAWDDTVPDARFLEGAAPRLAGATLTLPRVLVESYLERLLRTASRGGTREMATLDSAMERDLDALALFCAALRQAPDVIAQAAVACGADPDALQSVAALVVVPFVQACQRSWGPTPDWVEPYCPVCGSWPAFAEVLGIERSRQYRCGRCGSEWHAPGLSCPFCATTDHLNLVRLVPGDPGATSLIEACTTCRGYVKAFNRLQGCAPLAVLIEDLGGVALDLVALEQGYSRPTTAGYALNVTLIEAPARRRFFAWNA